MMSTFCIIAALPEGKKEIIVAPTNAAFEKLLGKLGLTSEELINSELFVPTLATHIAVASNNGASQADTVAGSKIRMYAGIDTVDKLALSSIPIGVVDTSATVQGPMNKGIVSRTINCNDGKYVLVSDSVLEPKEINGAVPPATPDVIVPEPTMMPEEITTPATPVDIPTVTASPEMMSPEMMTPEVMTPEVVVPSTVNATVVEASPEPMPQAPPSPAPVLPVIATDSATGLKAVVASAVAVVAAALM